MFEFFAKFKRLETGFWKLDKKTGNPPVELIFIIFIVKNQKSNSWKIVGEFFHASTEYKWFLRGWHLNFYRTESPRLLLIPLLVLLHI